MGEKRGSAICSWFATNVVARISSAKRKRSTIKEKALGINRGPFSCLKVAGAAGVFNGNHDKRQKADEALVARLYQQIGQLKVERDFLAERSGPWAGSGGGRWSTAGTQYCQRYDSAP